MDSDDKSILSLFKTLTQLRVERRTLRQGPKARFIRNTVNVVSYIREMEMELERFFIAINFGQDKSFENDFFYWGNGELPIEGTILVSTDMTRNGDRIQLNKIALGAGEGVIVLLDEIVKVDAENWWYQYFKPSA